MNYFDHQTAAERYAQSRPFFHPLVIDHVRAFLRLQGAVPLAVDVACGTGMSALALTDLADLVVGTDLSCAMLAQSPGHERIRFVAARAEQLPMGSHIADVVTVSLGFHWLDRSRFLAEAHRILRPFGTLAIYGNGFFGRMKENPAFARWNEAYLARYPTPARNNKAFTDEDAGTAGFAFVGRDHYTNEISFSPEELTDYLMTQSNVISAVEQGSEALADVKSWLLASVCPYFLSEKATFKFGGEIWFLRSIPAR